jgi:hypothetical protein
MSDKPTFNNNASPEEPSSSSSSTAQKQSYAASTSSSSSKSNVELSPEKVAAKRARPNPTTPTKAISIEIGKTLEERLPLWVAGASPAKFIALEDIIKVGFDIFIQQNCIRNEFE